MKRSICHIVARTLVAAWFYAVLGNGDISCAAQGLPVTMTQIGDPAFDLVDVNLYSPNFFPTMEFEVSQIIQPDHARYFDTSTGEVGFGPHVPHAPQYHSELSEGIAAAGFKTGSVYNRDDFSRGVGLAFMQIPNTNSPLGTTPDYESGPALGLDTYPYAITIRAVFEGQPIVLDERVSEPFPPDPGTLVYEDGTPITLAGLLESHLSTNFAIGAPLEVPNAFVVGNYEYQVSFLDVDGNGREFTVPFSVVPEPSSLIASLILAVVCVGWARVRRWRQSTTGYRNRPFAENACTMLVKPGLDRRGCLLPSMINAIDSCGRRTVVRS